MLIYLFNYDDGAQDRKASRGTYASPSSATRQQIRAFVTRRKTEILLPYFLSYILNLFVDYCSSATSCNNHIIFSSDFGSATTTTSPSPTCTSS